MPSPGTKYPARIGVMSRSAVEDGGQPRSGEFRSRRLRVPPAQRLHRDRTGHEMLIPRRSGTTGCSTRIGAGRGEQRDADRWRSTLPQAQCIPNTRRPGQNSRGSTRRSRAGTWQLASTKGLDGGFGGGRLRTAVYSTTTTPVRRRVQRPDRQVGEMVFVINPVPGARTTSPARIWADRETTAAIADPSMRRRWGPCHWVQRHS